MGLSPFFNISTDYKDQKTFTSWESRLFAEIVFVDKTHSALPLLYQLKISSSNVADSQLNFLSIPKNSFILIGSVNSINRKKKEILLTNKNIVSYSYLVIASGTNSSSLSSFQDQEFLAGLQTLNDALKVKPKIPSSFASQEKPHFSTTKSAVQPMEEKHSPPLENIEKISSSSLPFLKTISHNLSTLGKRLYEILL